MSLAEFIATRAYPVREEKPDRFWFQSAPLPDGTRIRSVLGLQDTQYLGMEEFHAFDTALFDGKRVLDIGAADGLYAMAALRGGAASVVALDCDYTDWPKNVEFLRDQWGLDGLEIRTGDFREMPLEQFDAILMMGVLYHLEDPFHSIRKLSRLLPAGGVLIVETQLAQVQSELPVFELASDVFATIADQGQRFLDAVGVSNYVFPNVPAMQQLALMYGMECMQVPDSPYSAAVPGRGIFFMRKLGPGESWAPDLPKHLRR